MRITRIQIHGDQNITFRIFNAKVITHYLADQIIKSSYISRLFSVCHGALPSHKVKVCWL